MFSEILKDIVRLRISLSNSIQNKDEVEVKNITLQLESLYSSLPLEYKDSIKSMTSESIMIEVREPILFKSIMLERVNIRSDDKIFTPDNVESLMDAIKKEDNKIKVSLNYTDSTVEMDAWLYQKSLYDETGTKITAGNKYFNSTNITATLKSSLESYLYKIDIDLNISINSYTSDNIFPIPPNSILDNNNTVSAANNYIGEDKEKYKYAITISNILPKQLELEDTFCYVSETMKTAKNIDYVKIKSIFNITESSSIEFYIIDELGEHAINIEGSYNIKNEKIFQGLPTRFNILNDSYIIKSIDTNEVISITLEEALKSENLYMIDYMTDESTDTYYTQGLFKVKVIVRFNKTYENEQNSNSIETIYLKKYLSDNYDREEIFITDNITNDDSSSSDNVIIIPEDNIDKEDLIIKSTVLIKYDVIVKESEWVNDTLLGFWTNNIYMSDIGEQDFVSIQFALSSITDSTNVLQTTDSFDGYIKIYAKDNKPIKDLICDISIAKE